METPHPRKMPDSTANQTPRQRAATILKTIRGYENDLYATALFRVLEPEQLLRAVIDSPLNPQIYRDNSPKGIEEAAKVLTVKKSHMLGYIAQISGEGPDVKKLILSAPALKHYHSMVRRALIEVLASDADFEVMRLTVNLRDGRK